MKNKSGQSIKSEKRHARELTNFENKCAKTEYKNIFRDTDIIYDLQARGVKESIVIKKTPAQPVTYTME